jgi:hypothetical protein
MLPSDSKSYRKVKQESDRNFGLFFAIVFAVIALLPVLHSEPPRLWPLFIAVGFVGCAYLAPRLLRPLNQLWSKLGLLLSHIVNPVIMALVFYGMVVPTGLILHAFGKDLLRLRREPEIKSYWIEKPAPPPGSMTKQF